jgi:tetratricopeptide (TPR) repeat protein
MLEEAIAAYERGVDLEPEDLQFKGELALVYAAAGQKAQAQRLLEELKEKARREYVTPVALALAHMAVGDLDATFTWLDKLEEHSPKLIWINTNASFDPLRGDPRFHELRRKIGFTEAQIEAADALAGKRH